MTHRIPKTTRTRRPRRRAEWIAAAYAVGAALWIGFSDRTIGILFADPDLLVRWSVFKGLAFVGVTTTLLWLVLRKTFGAMDENYTALLAHEVELERVSRLFAALSQINHAIVWTKSRDELLDSVCRALVDHGGFLLAWVGWHNPATHTLEPIAIHGDEHDYARSIRIHTDDRPEEQGATGRAFRSGQPVVCNDFLNDSVTAPWRQEAKRRGVRSSAAFPIRLRDQAVGTLSVYAALPGFYRDREMSLLAEAAANISFALDNLDRDDERRRAETEAGNERRFSNTMIESMPGILYLYDMAGRFLRWNRNFAAVSGYSDEEIACMHPHAFFSPEDRAAVELRIAEVFKKGESTVEARFRGRDGRTTPYFFTGRRVVFNGRTCLVGVGIDMTERKKAESALRLSEARYRTLFEYAPDGILIADAHSTYLDANASMCKMLGYTHDEFVGMSAHDIVAPAEVAGIDPVIEQIQMRADHCREWQFRRKDGSILPVEVIATMMPDGHMLGMVRDITDRREAERALRELNASLEHKVAERTADLRIAVARAEDADRIKSAFLATMSHELRTPLNSIIGFTGIILQGLAGPLNAEQTKQLGMVRNSARHLLALINDVLDISKIEAGQLEVRLEPFDLAEVIERITASVMPLAEKKGLALSTALPPDLGTLVSDRRRLEQILLNLLNNAIKFTENGEVRLEVECTADPRPQAAGGTVSLRVTDTGIGIKPDDLATLFQPFRQIDTGLQRHHEGTGLGLAICRRLATLMGGEISAASVCSQGSTFTLTLPRHRPSPP